MGIEMENMWDAMKQAHYKRTLEELQKAIGNAPDAVQAMEAALNQVVEAIHAEAGTFWFFDRFGDDLIHPTAVYGGGDIQDIRLMPGEGVAGKVIETGEGVVIPDCQLDSRWAGKVDKKTGFTTKTMICVPLMIDDMSFGSIQIINKVDGIPFDKADYEFTMKLAESASQMLAEHEMLRAYLVYNDRELEDTTTFESMMYAPTTKELLRLTKQTNCWQILNRQEKDEAEKHLMELYRIYEKALARKEGKDEPVQRRGLFGWRK